MTKQLIYERREFKTQQATKRSVASRHCDRLRCKVKGVRGCDPWSAADWSSEYDLHRFARAAADDSKHVQEGERTPFVLHVAARSVAAHILSIFGDQSENGSKEKEKVAS